VRGRQAVSGLGALAVCAVALTAAVPAAGGSPGRDDTQWLQAQLDAGGNVFLSKLPNGQCYATRGLWVSRDGTSISSDGACIVALGPGEARIKSRRPVHANAVFYLNHSDIRRPVPVRVTITGLRISVPAAKRMHGVAVFAHETTLSHLIIDGSPLTDVLIGSGSKGVGGLTSRVAVTESRLVGGKRDAITAYGPVGLRIEGNTVASAHGAGIHIRSADRGQPTLDVRVSRNRIAGNDGPGIFFELDPANGMPVLAARIEISGNQVVDNARKASAARRGGIVLAGGQNDGKGRIAVTDNVVRGNRGPGILGRRLTAQLDSERNELRGNRGGPMKVTRARAAAGAAPGARSLPPLTSPTPRDDTSWLQARLDRRGGTIFLPRLPGGDCYATRGLWVSHDDTTITSDGACIVSLGLGPTRLRSIDGDPIAASAVFFVNRSQASKPAPIQVTISNLRIVVPAGQSMYGVAIYGHQITLSHLDISGSPKDDVTISGRANGNGYAGRISILDSTLSGANRNAISATSVVDLRIEGNTIEGVRDTPPGQPAAGIDIEPDDRSQPALAVRILRNTIKDNAGPGIMLELESNEGHAVVATELEISGNTILRNARKPTPPKRAGVVLAGGQDGEEGTLLLRDNVIRDNGGPGILTSRLRLVVQGSGNDVGGNEAGP
jgi:parallel beta helix pectate lyase-like protein